MKLGGGREGCGGRGKWMVVSVESTDELNMGRGDGGWDWVREEYG